ncbi:MAG: hypothetical protein KF789_03840 [Bdellovibrionaceae bacterium]|nr:hypothetical protein [Pseudobdellovibrionaceae bacterium]
MPTSKVGIFFRLLFSAWLLFHVFVIVVMPNGLSYPGRVLGSVIYPYAAMVGLNVSWNFFSPDPAHTMYLRFTLFQENEDGETSMDEPRIISMPEEKDQGVWDLGRRRDLYAMRYFLLDPRRIQAVLGPWLCRHYAPVSVIRIEHVVDSIPTLDEAVLFSDRALGEMSQQVGFSDQEYRCSQMNDEVGL